jgi:wobble nucleotide-excising tRNase
MVKKFIAIRNVGKFRNHNAAGDVEFRKLSLIYAENGRGKTTLSAILRSLESGDPLFITERRTVDSNGAPQVDVLTANGKLTFDGNSWSGTYPNLAIFDSAYVAENVYSGDFVEHDQKKRFYQVSIGKQGVDLAKKVADFDNQSRELAEKLKGTNQSLTKKLPEGLTLDQFLALAKDEDIDTKIAEKKKSIEALVDAGTVKTKSAFVKLVAPSLSIGLSEMLAKGLDGVSKDAEDKIRQHIAAHKMGTSGHSWISQGLPYVQNETCPFCDQDVSKNALLQAYRSYFSAAYDDFKTEIKAFETDFSTAFSDKNEATLKTTLVQNQANVDFWKKYTVVSLPDLVFEDSIGVVIQAAVQKIGTLIRQKVAAPLDAITFSPEAQQAAQDLDALKSSIDDYNRAVDIANTAVTVVKQAVETGNPTALRKELARLEAQKSRHTEDVSASCTEHLNAQQEKTRIGNEKAQAKDELDGYTEAVLQKYEKGINDLLDRFGAGFRITGTKQQYLGGSPSSTFKLSINGVPVELGDSRTPRGTPCFRTTMSSGDRSTLALAFFLVQLQQRQDINALTVIFDDPLTSLDRFRQQFTRDQIRAIEKKAKQVVVLSHEPAFLQLIADDFDSANLRLLSLSREGLTDSTIKEWDMRAELAPGYHKDVATLTSYYYGEAEDLRAVIRCIRPVLESHMRSTYHAHFPEKEWLGEMIARIKGAVAGQPLESAKPILSDLESLNDYTKRYHHDDNSPKQSAATIQDAELQTFAKLTLQLTNRL